MATTTGKQDTSDIIIDIDLRAASDNIQTDDLIGLFGSGWDEVAAPDTVIDIPPLEPVSSRPGSSPDPGTKKGADRRRAKPKPGPADAKCFNCGKSGHKRAQCKQGSVGTRADKRSQLIAESNRNEREKQLGIQDALQEFASFKAETDSEPPGPPPGPSGDKTPKSPKKPHKYSLWDSGNISSARKFLKALDGLTVLLEETRDVRPIPGITIAILLLWILAGIFHFAGVWSAVSALTTLGAFSFYIGVALLIADFTCLSLLWVFMDQNVIGSRAMNWFCELLELTIPMTCKDRQTVHFSKVSPETETWNVPEEGGLDLRPLGHRHIFMEQPAALFRFMATEKGIRSYKVNLFGSPEKLDCKRFLGWKNRRPKPMTASATLACALTVSPIYGAETDLTVLYPRVTTALRSVQDINMNRFDVLSFALLDTEILIRWLLKHKVNRVRSLPPTN